MIDESRIENAVSKTIGYIRRRLTVGDSFSTEVQFNQFEDMDKLVAHLRSRLKPVIKPQKYKHA